MLLSVGYELVQVFDEGRNLRFPMLVTYPTASAETVEQLGPFSLSVACGAPPMEGAHPLVIVSHGSGGTPLSHRELARHLASCGFVVGVPEHPHNNRNDNTFAERVELLGERSRDIRVVVDWFFQHSQFSPVLKAGSFSIVGHSMGASTALAVAGGMPTSLPHQSADQQAKRIEVEHDPRVDALVLLAPATPWFRLRGSLEGVRAPILMIASRHDEITPSSYMCQIVLDGVPESTNVDYRLVEGAGHYSFLSPWPEAMKSPAIPPSQDPPGFDRRTFLDQIYAEIGSFLARAV